MVRILLVVMLKKLVNEVGKKYNLRISLANKNIYSN